MRTKDDATSDGDSGAVTLMLNRDRRPGDYSDGITQTENDEWGQMVADLIVWFDGHGYRASLQSYNVALTGFQAHLLARRRK